MLARMMSGATRHGRVRWRAEAIPKQQVVITGRTEISGPTISGTVASEVARASVRPLEVCSVGGGPTSPVEKGSGQALAASRTLLTALTPARWISPPTRTCVQPASPLRASACRSPLRVLAAWVHTKRRKGPVATVSDRHRTTAAYSVLSCTQRRPNKIRNSHGSSRYLQRSQESRVVTTAGQQVSKRHSRPRPNCQQ